MKGRKRKEWNENGGKGRTGMKERKRKEWNEKRGRGRFFF